jgi:general stress protein YciG
MSTESPAKKRKEKAPSGNAEEKPAKPKTKRGFASMDPEKQRRIASVGGKRAHAVGTAHQFTSDEAREAGRKGGGRVSEDRRHMADIGRMGGQSRGRKEKERRVDAPQVESPAEPDAQPEETTAN